MSATRRLGRVLDVRFPRITQVNFHSETNLSDQTINSITNEGALNGCVMSVCIFLAACDAMCDLRGVIYGSYVGTAAALVGTGVPTPAKVLVPSAQL